MASEGGSAMPGRDPAWKYCSPIEDMHPDERDAYRSAVRASKASNWEREQHENIVGSKRKLEESSTGIYVDDAKIIEYATFASFTPYCPSLYKSSAARQKNIKDIFKGGAIKETMGRLISKFFIYESVAPAKAKSHHFKNMIIVHNKQCRNGIEPPSPYEIKNKYLEMEYKEMEAYVNQQREKWKTYAQMRKYCGGDIVRPGATRLTNIVSLYEPLYVVLRLVDSEVVPTMPFVYELMHVMKENLIRQGAGDWMFKIIQDRWEKTLKHPLHAAAYFLNPRFQYRRGVGSDPELLQAVHDVFAKLDPTTESLGQFGNEMQKEDSVIERQLQQGQPWCPLNGGLCMESNTYIEKVSHQSSLTNCVIFCMLKLRDMEAENDRVAEKDYLDLLDISAEVGEEEDNQLFQWVRPIHLDDEVGNPDPRIAAHAREFGVNVECVVEEVHSESFSKDTDDSLHAALIPTKRLTPQVLAIVVDLVLQVLLLLVTMVQEVELMMEDEDHGSRRAGPGIGAIGKPYRGRERMMEPYNEELLSGSFESMSIGTQFSDSSNEANVYPPHVMSYGQPSSSTDEEYGMSRYSPSRQMPYQVPYQMEEGFDVNTWVNFEYPIHVEVVGRTQEIYAWHVRIYNQYYRGSLSWYQYCLQQQAGVPSSINPIEPHRSSFWY
ncbi:hypothetical protein CK203_086899 [Vitis vinifera]|uniref:Uncharacterized protein n=1 Tax=Vitis vinifera TaxID=29760 RepID=A0A438EAT0_VITVI|nr:hypothetical protein CK203_086899 [Vitis vinifera]